MIQRYYNLTKAITSNVSKHQQKKQLTLSLYALEQGNHSYDYLALEQGNWI